MSSATKFVLSVAVCTLAVCNGYPGAAYLHPTIHFATHVVSDQGGWHDIAGSITHDGVHHIFQGTGWNHAVSTDLVHWKTAPHGPEAIHETYAGMDSKSDPCSGFVTKDDKGMVCAGFRECGSNKGVAGFPNNWDVPLELRCAEDQSGNLAKFNPSPDDRELFSYLFNVSFWRSIPYDPARPWFEKTTGKWYQMLSMDACNATTERNIDHKTCPAGGQLVMWESPVMRGEGADWQLLGPVWTDNSTVLKDGFLSHEFVTIDFLGTMPGSPPSDAPTDNTFVFLNNVGGNGGGDGCCSGTTSYTILKQPQGPGTPFASYGPGQQMVDWGSFTFKSGHEQLLREGTSGLDLLTGTASRGLSMARTLGSEEADQVSQPGRRVLIGWTGPAPGEILGGSASAQSLPRDLSLDPESSRMLQRFVPELATLRQGAATAIDAATTTAAGMQPVEVLAAFPSSCAGTECAVTMLGDGATGLVVTLDPGAGLVTVNATTVGNHAVRAGPLPAAKEGDAAWVVHAIVDRSIVELIVNNDTAFVVYVQPPNTTAGTVAVTGGKATVWKLAAANQN